jgi:hypothetical protein
MVKSVSENCRSRNSSGGCCRGSNIAHGNAVTRKGKDVIILLKMKMLGSLASGTYGYGVLW